MRIDRAPSSPRPADDGRVSRNVRRVESAYSHTDLRRVVGQLSSAVERLQRADETLRGGAHPPPRDDLFAGVPEAPRDEPRPPLPHEPPPGERERDAEHAPDHRQREPEPREPRSADAPRPSLPGAGVPPGGASPASPLDATGARAGRKAAPTAATARLSPLLGDARVLAYTRPVPTPVGSQFSVRA